MTNGVAFDYNFGAKKHWRRSVWNEILRRTNRRERNEFVLYLAGKNDFDREIAISKGVPSENLIAIEKDSYAVTELRKRKIPVIEADLLDVLWSWPKERRVCAVLADYCSGLEWSNCGLYDCFARPVLREATIAINLQRGRDPWSNQIRSLLESTCMVDKTQERNRAYQFLMFHAFHTIQVLLDGADSKPNFADSAKETEIISFKFPSDEKELYVLRSLIKNLVLSMSPRYFSYRSTAGVTMDTAVFFHTMRNCLSRIPVTHHKLADEAGERFARLYELADLKQRITAMFAVRTRRLRCPVPSSCGMDPPMRVEEPQQ
jgi:hypothetical protein